MVLKQRLDVSQGGWYGCAWTDDNEDAPFFSYWAMNKAVVREEVANACCERMNELNVQLVGRQTVQDYIKE